MRKQLCFWLTGSLVAFASATAHAEDEPKPYPECTKEPTEAEVGAAKGAYQAGTASFDEADYPRAITYWEDAYRRDCTANLLLKNLARAYELSSQKRQAVVALETFLVREPNSNEKEQIQRRIEALKKQIAAEKAVTPVGPATPVVAPPTNTTPVTSEPAPQSHTGKKSLVPLFVAGGGGVVAIVGLAVYAGGAKDVTNFEKQCPNHMCPSDPNATTDAQKAAAAANVAKLTDDANKARSRKIAGGAIAGVGAAVAVGGVIWYLLEPRSAPASAGTLLRPRFDAAVSPGFSGVSLSGAF